jgi:hypothetical protein
MVPHLAARRQLSAPNTLQPQGFFKSVFVHYLVWREAGRREGMALAQAQPATSANHPTNIDATSA